MNKDKGSLKESRVLALTGEGRIVAKPDLASIALGISASADTAQAAMQQHTALLNSVLLRIQALSVSAEDLRISGFTITPLGDREAPETGRITGYRVEDTVTVKVDVQRAAEILDEGVAAGASIAGGIAFRVRDEAPYRAQALRAAAQAAQREAETVAQAMGVKLRGKKNAEVVYGGSPEIYRTLSPRDAPSCGEPGVLLFTAGIRITYEFRSA
jgi:uncharacterized protein YggE